MLRSKPADAVGPSTGRRRRAARLLGARVVVVAVLGAVTGRLFIWPASGMPARVSAIVMLNGPGDPLSVALRLAHQRRAEYLVISQGTPASHFACPRPVPRVRLICFHPSLATTQGEAQYAGRLARKYRWRSITLVTITPQATRARLRLERCFSGHVYVATAAIPPGAWPYEIAYEWGATIKALALQRSC